MATLAERVKALEAWRNQAKAAQVILEVRVTALEAVVFRGRRTDG